MIEVARSLGDRRKGRRRPLFVLLHIKILRATVTSGIFAVEVIDVGWVAAEEQYMLVRIRIADGSPPKEMADCPWRKRVHVFLLVDPSGDLDHRRIVVEGHRLSS